MAIKFIIQARENSQRFPKKCFVKIGKEYAIDKLISTIKKSKFFKKGNLYFVIPKEDQGLCAYLNKEQITHDINRDIWYAFTNIGERDDILVRMTADSPLLPVEEIDRNIQKVVDGYEYASNELTMFGKACEAFKYISLIKYPPVDAEDRQHVTLSIRRASENKWIPSLMLDYPEAEKWINEYICE
jgi:spore coat polysaccharide biosynthesis protein SpsF (cytidylyltransferase family)